MTCVSRAGILSRLVTCAGKLGLAGNPMIRIKDRDISLMKTTGDLCLKSRNNFCGFLETSGDLCWQARSSWQSYDQDQGSGYLLGETTGDLCLKCWNTLGGFFLDWRLVLAR